MCHHEDIVFFFFFTGCVHRIQFIDSKGRKALKMNSCWTLMSKTITQIKKTQQDVLPKDAAENIFCLVSSCLSHIYNASECENDCCTNVWQTVGEDERAHLSYESVSAESKQKGLSRRVLASTHILICAGNDPFLLSIFNFKPFIRGCSRLGQDLPNITHPCDCTHTTNSGRLQYTDTPWWWGSLCSILSTKIIYCVTGLTTYNCSYYKNGLMAPPAGQFSTLRHV